MKNSEMTNELVFEALKNQFNKNIGEASTPFDILTVEINKEFNFDIINWLYNHETYKFQFLTNITGVHYPDNVGEELIVVYHLHSLQNNFRVRLKAKLNIENPMINSIVEIFSAANWLERETFDFFGIQFEGHPNLIRILNEESMDYHPMRKEYQLEDQTRQDKDNRFFGR